MHRTALRSTGWALAASSLLVLGGCSGANPDDLPTDPEVFAEAESPLTEEQVEEDRDAPTIEAAELLAEPANHLGESLIVEAVVEQIFAPGAFTLTAEGLDAEDSDFEGALGLDEETAAGTAGLAPADGAFVVVGPTEGLAPGDAVLVSGIVRDGLDGADLDDPFVEAWDDGQLAEFTENAWLDAEYVEPVAG